MKCNYKIFKNQTIASLVMLSLFWSWGSWGQQNVFSRSESGTDLWWNDNSANRPWYYESWNSNEPRPDYWPIPTRNNVFIGHNNNTTMNVNGAFFQLRTLTIQESATSNRIYNASSGGGISLSVGYYKLVGSGNQTFNVQIGLDGTSVDFSAADGTTTFNNNFFINGNTARFIGAGNITVGGVAQGTNGKVLKEGSGTLTLSGNNTYTGSTTISEGTLRLNRPGGTTIPNTNSVTINGGTLRVSTNQTLENLTLTTGGLTIDNGITLSLPNGVSIPDGFTITNNGTLVIEGTLTDNRTTKTFDGTVRYAASSGTQTVVGGTYLNLELASASSKEFGGDVTISGNFVVAGGNVTPPSTITFNGSSPQSIAGLAYNNIAFSNGGSNAKTFTSNASVSSTSAITFSGDTGTVDFDGDGSVEFVLQSTDQGTARVDEVPNGWTLSGQVRAERYIKQKLAWRLLTTPLLGDSNNSVYTNWQNTDAGTGMYLWNPQAAPIGTSGLNQGQGIANVYRFGTPPNAGWNALTNTLNEPLFTDTTNNSFLVFATGPANVGGSNLPAEATTLRPKGSLRVGDVVHTNLAATYHLLGNPYASALDIATLKSSNPAAFGSFWLLDPNLGGFGAYVTYNGSVFAPSTNGAHTYSTTNTRIESGQAFFVRPSVEATFTFQESHKAENVSYSMSRMATQTETSITGVRLNLYKPIDNQYTIVDGIVAVFDENETNAVTGIDSRKLSNSNENIMFRNSNISLAIDMRAMPTLTDELAVRMTNTVANTAYQIHAYVESFENMPLQAYLLDTQTQQLTAIPMDGSSLVYPFTGMNASNTQPDERFKVIFQNTALSNNDLEQPIMSLYPNPATKGSIFMNTTASSAELRVELTNIHGQKVLNSIAEPVGPGQYRLDVSKLSSGVYLLKAIDTDYEWIHKIIID